MSNLTNQKVIITSKNDVSWAVRRSVRNIQDTDGSQKGVITYQGNQMIVTYHVTEEKWYAERL